MDKMQRVSDECSNSALIDSTAIGDDQGTIQSECGEEENNQVLEAIEQSMKMHQSLGGRGIKRDVDELHSSSSDHEDMEDTKVGLKPGKKTRGRVKIKMEYIDNKLRRYTTFSKRKTGIMKKAYELSTLTGTQVMLLVASETGHVYTFATRKLQPMITSESGKALIQTCLNSPDPSVTTVALDQRMSATGYEEPDLSYSSHDGVNIDKDGKASIYLNQNIDLSQTGTGSAMTGITLQSAGNGSFPMTTYLPPSSGHQNSVSKSGSGVQSLSVQAVPGGAFATIFTPGATFPNGTYQLGQGTQQPLTQVSPQLHLQRMQAATTTANSHMNVNCTAASHNHHDGHDHQTGDSPSNHSSPMSNIPINVLSMQGNNDASGQNVVLTSGNMPLMYSSGILYATPSTQSQTTLSDGGDSGGQAHHIIMHDGTVVTNPGLQHASLQVHQDYSGSLQHHHSNGLHDAHSGDMVNHMVDPGSLSVHADGSSVLETKMNSHKH